ncbi:hypothetical protein Tsubulata_019677, partial [Turnera subulata]
LELRYKTSLLSLFSLLSSPCCSPLFSPTFTHSLPCSLPLPDSASPLLHFSLLTFTFSFLCFSLVLFYLFLPSSSPPPFFPTCKSRGRGKGAQCDVIDAPIGLCSKELDKPCASAEHGYIDVVSMSGNEVRGILSHYQFQGLHPKAIDITFFIHFLWEEKKKN